MSSSELALEAAETALDISAPDSPSSSQALALTANSSRCTSPQFSPQPQFLNDDDDEEQEGEGEEGEEEEEEEGEGLQNLQNLQALQEHQETDGAPIESESFEDDENITSLNLSLSSKQVDNSSTDIPANNNEHQQEQEEELLLQQQHQLESINKSGNCSSRNSSCSRSSSNGSVNRHQDQQQDQQEQHEQISSAASPPRPPSLPSAQTVVNNNLNPFNQFAENHDLPSGGINLSNNVSASALAAAAAFRVGHNNSSKNFHHKSESSSMSRGKSSSKSHTGGSSGNNTLSYAADYSSVPNPQSPDFVQLLLEYRQVLLDMLAKSITLNTDADYTAVGAGGDPKSVNLPLKCQCGFTSKLSNQITRSSTYVHQLELRFRSLMEASRATEAKYTPKRPNFINSASKAFAGTKGSLLDKKAAHLSLQASASASAASSTAAGKPVSLFAGRSGASSINSSLNGDDDEGDADSEEDDVNEDEHHLPGNLNLANFNGAVGSLVEEMNGSGAALGGGSGNAGGKTILEGYLESMKNNLPSEDGGSEDEDAGKIMMVNQMGGGGGAAEDNELDGFVKRIDLQTKRLIVQMINGGISVSDISRNIGVSRKAVKQIVANYRTYGMLEKKRESRIQKGMQSLVVKLYAQGRSLSEISRATNISKPTITKIIKQYADLNPALSAQGPNGLIVQHNGGGSALPNMKPHVEMQQHYANDALDDDMDDEEKGMVIDEDAGDDDEFDDDDEEMAMKNAHLMDGPNSILSAGSAFPLALTKQQHPLQPPMKKQRTAMSLIHNSFNNGNSGGVGSGGAFNLQQSPQQAHMNSNGNSTSHQQQQQLLQSQLSLFQERFNNNGAGGKPFDMKTMRHTSNHGSGMSGMMDLLTQQQQHNSHRKSSHIVPQAADTAKLQAMLRHQQQQQKQQQQQQQLHMRMNSSSPRGENNHHRMKSMKSMNHRLSNEMSIKESIMSMPEADRNNNTTLANCNTMTISATGAQAPLTLNGNALAAMGGGHLSNSSSGQHSPSESNALLPPISTSMGDSNSDSEGNMMARPFVDGFPAGIMNSLNPNRATKLTLEDFNVVWQLRSQHWTHNQIRKYFEQRGKSISKSSISRIMNGKQRNFQQFFNVIPSTL